MARLRGRWTALALAVSMPLAACSSEEPSTSPESSTPLAVSSAPAETSPETAPSTSAETAPSTSADEVVLWDDVTEDAIGPTAAWSNKVELADLDGDNDVDLLFADGGDYESPGDPVVSQAWINDGTGGFEDRSVEILGEVPALARVIKVRDVNADGLVDIFVGTTYQTQSRLYLGTGGLGFAEVTESNLPQSPLSVGDAEFGDVDADGDLDLVLADWGPDSPMTNPGSQVQLWLNDGAGRFSDVTSAQMPTELVRFSWELEFVDADNDWDLDLVVSCKMCSSSFFFVNDGAGMFGDASNLMPDFTNNYDFEVADLNGDGLQDLVTINDGPNSREHVFAGDPAGGFIDMTDAWWPTGANIGGDDNMIVVIDYDSDGDPDFVIGSLDSDDRLLVNDGTGHLTLFEGTTFAGRPSRGTLGIATADLDADGRLDMVEAQGEVDEDERVYRGTSIAPDTAPPVIGTPVLLDGQLKVRLHDSKTPVADHDFRSATVTDPGGTVDLQWYGEALWTAPITASGDYTICATDHAGNSACIGPIELSP